MSDERCVNAWLRLSSQNHLEKTTKRGGKSSKIITDKNRLPVKISNF